MKEDIIYLSNKYDELYIQYKNIVRSSEFRIGKKLYKIPLLKYVWNLLRKDKNEKYTVGHDKILLTKEDLEWKPKVVVYQTIIGNYDVFHKHLDLYKELYNYILFTDLDISVKDITVKKIPEELNKLNSPILINRYLKMHPYELFSDYDYAVYLDGNIQIISDIRPMLRQVSPETGLALHQHSYRDCIYDEEKICIKFKRGNRKKINTQIEKYQRAGFPNHWGLFECNVIISDLKNKSGEKILSLWWEEFLSSGSLRDQLSLPYILWKNGYKKEHIGHFYINISQNPKLYIHNHIKSKYL